MQQLPFGQRNGLTVARGSIGGMRLPADIDEAVAVIRRAIDSGMKYIDTSRGYGDSEIKIGKALKDGYREKVILSTKWAPWIVKIEESDDSSADCVRKRIDESMKRLDVEYLDYYQVWNIQNRENYDAAVCKGGFLEGIQKAMAEGLVRRTGFTTHDSVENLLSYMPEIDWADIILFTFNILNRSYMPAIKAAHERGIGTIIMNPVCGGMLNQENPTLAALSQKVGAKNIADMGIRWLMSQPYVTTIISGITTLEDVDRSVASVTDGAFTPEQAALIDAKLDELDSMKEAFCTGCRYCMPCPQGIEIPAIMGMNSTYRFQGFQQNAKDQYAALQGSKADACVQCGECEAKCTQHLPIMDEMRWACENLV
ncbi:MAG: aldo/keto reductase [Armatimonadota bacterium]